MAQPGPRPDQIIVAPSKPPGHVLMVNPDGKGEFLDPPFSIPALDEFTPTNGQTVFVLSAIPDSVDTILFIVNGVSYKPGIAFTVGGVNNQTITWTNVEFVIDDTDEVFVQYATE